MTIFTGTTFVDKMPIKDISKEEQSNLFLSGKVRRDPVRLTESDRGRQRIIKTDER